MSFAVSNYNELLLHIPETAAHSLWRTKCPMCGFIVEKQWHEESDLCLSCKEKVKQMHYRNGREAKNGDKVVQLQMDGPVITGVGILYDAVPGRDYCNGNIAPTQPQPMGACMCDCLHVDDLAEILKDKGLDKRPSGK